IYGNLSMNVSVNGSQLNPQGGGLVRLVQAKVYGQPLQQLAVQFNGSGESLASSLDVSMPAGSAHASVVYYPNSKRYELDLNIPGVDLAQLQLLRERNLGIGGTLTAVARGRGILDDPQMSGTVQIPQLQIQGKSVSGIKADLTVANHKADLAVDSEVAQTLVH